MELTSKTIEQLLTAHHLLVAKPDSDQTFDFLHYDTRQVKDQTLFVVKGAFRVEYLAQAAGVTGLVTEELLPVDLPQWQVTDVQKALSVLSMAFLTIHKMTCGLVPLRGQKENNRGVHGLSNLTAHDASAYGFVFNG